MTRLYCLGESRVIAKEAEEKDAEGAHSPSSTAGTASAHQAAQHAETRGWQQSQLCATANQSLSLDYKPLQSTTIYMAISSCVPGMAHASAERMDGGWQEEHDALSLEVFIFTCNREGQTPPVPLTLVELTRQHLLGMEQWASSKTLGRVRDRLNRFQNKTISTKEAGFSFQFSHMLKFLSPSSLAAAVQGTWSTEQQAVHLLTFDKKQMRKAVNSQSTIHL